MELLAAAKGRQGESTRLFRITANTGKRRLPPRDDGGGGVSIVAVEDEPRACVQMSFGLVPVPGLELEIEQRGKHSLSEVLVAPATRELEFRLEKFARV